MSSYNKALIDLHKATEVEYADASYNNRLARQAARKRIAAFLESGSSCLNYQQTAQAILNILSLDLVAEASQVEVKP